MSRKFIFMVIRMVVLSFVFCFFIGNARAQEGVETTILDLVAGTHDLSTAHLEIGFLRGVSLPVTGVSYYQAKVVDTSTGQAYSVAVDPSGKPVDAQALRQAEKDAARALYGALVPGLYQKLQGMGADERLVVGVWLKSGDIRPLPRLPLEESFPTEVPAPDISQPAPPVPPQEKPPFDIGAINAERAAALVKQQADINAQIAILKQANRQSIAAQVTTVEAPFLADLTKMGYRPQYTSPYAPLIYVEMPKSAILELAQRTDIDAIYGPNQNHDTLDIAKPTQKGNWVDYTFGFTGSGVSVAMIENDRINDANPYFPTVTFRDITGGIDQHANATAGFIASQHSTYNGIARDVTLFDANSVTYDDANVSAALDWAVSQGVDIISSSWGGNDGTGNLNVHDRHYDWVVRHTWTTISASAGNEADGCGAGDGRIGSPGRAYSVITVGNYDDNRTLSWDDDFMDSCSSFVDPVSGLKPEVSAVGSHDMISLTNIAPWFGNVGSGTSYSAPMVAGAAALIMERYTWLKDWPESVKATMLAASLHNIEGATRFSDKDGAGGLDMRAAFRITDEVWNNGLDETGGSWSNDQYFYVSQGQVARAAVAWDSHASDDYTSDPLNTDIDIQVFDPSGGFVTGSYSFNSFEIVEFTAATSGNYRLHIYPATMSGQEFIGFAIWRGIRVLDNYVPQNFSTPSVSRHSFTFTPGSYWNVVGIRPPAAADYDLILYPSSPYGDPEDFDWLDGSWYGTGSVDFIVIDRNHAPNQPYYADVYAVSGSGSYAIQRGGWSGDTSTGAHGPYTMQPGDVVRVWDSLLTSGVTKYYGLKVTSGDANLAMGLYKSNDADPSTFYQGRNHAVAEANAAGAGGNEFMSYTSTTNDWLGLVVWNNSATSATTYYVYTDETAPSAGSISINGGDAYTNAAAVTLTLSATDAESGVGEMSFSNDGIAWSLFEAYNTSKSWTLPAGDGVKTVYVKYRNNANMVGSIYTDNITLDTVAPTGSIVVNGGATYATNATVTLTLSAADGGSGVYQMRFSNDAITWSAWQAYAASKSWALSGADGAKTVFVQYRDNALNNSPFYSDGITLDRAAPTGSIVINGGDAYTNSGAVTLSLSAADATSGVYQMRFSNDGSTWSAWEAYAASKSWTLLTGDGTKTVYVQYRDNALNVSSSYSDGITLDKVAPTGSITINSGDPYTNNTLVSLALPATDATSGVYQMRLSDDGVTWGAWQAYSATKSWSLPGGDGSKRVYVQYRDHALNGSSSFSDNITLDTSLPSSSASSPAKATKLGFLVSWSGTDTTSGIQCYDVQYRVGSGGTWTNWLTCTTATSAMFGPSSPVHLSVSQTYYFRVRARDLAGNIEAYPSGADTSTFIQYMLYLPIIHR